MSDRTIGPVTVLAGDKNGKYPDGNSLLIRGSEGSLLFDPALGVSHRSAEDLPPCDQIVLSHVHEDHVAGLHRYPDTPVRAHALDAPGLRSIGGLMAMYGYGELTPMMEEFVLQEFHFEPRPDTGEFTDGAVFDLGDVKVRAIHTPGHTRGHCVLLVEPDDILFLGDIELSSFGPYYGDAWSNLDDFARSIGTVREIDANTWISFHHVGVVEDRQTFDQRLDRFEQKIEEREAAILAALAQPHTLAKLVEQRFLYPPHAEFPFIDAVEQRTIEQHLTRLVAAGRIETQDDRFQAIDAKP